MPVGAVGCEDASKDKLLLLGNVLKEVYQAKLLWQFPDRPCSVEFIYPMMGGSEGIPALVLAKMSRIANRLTYVLTLFITALSVLRPARPLWRERVVLL